MTWKEFKEHIESQGVTDGMELSYMDCGYEKDDVNAMIDGNVFSVGFVSQAYIDDYNKETAELAKLEKKEKGK